VDSTGERRYPESVMASILAVKPAEVRKLMLAGYLVRGCPGPAVPVCIGPSSRSPDFNAKPDNAETGHPSGDGSERNVHPDRARVVIRLWGRLAGGHYQCDGRPSVATPPVRRVR
jgi:hypothetical protein